MRRCNVTWDAVMYLSEDSTETTGGHNMTENQEGNMTETGAAKPQGTSRRTVVKGAAWAVPAVALAGAAPAFAASKEPPPPTVSWAGACATTGSGAGCSGQSQALQVPVTIKNTTGSPLLFVVEGAWSANGNSNPTVPANPPAAGGAGSGYGFFGIGANPYTCTTLIPPTDCTSISPIASASSQVLVAAGDTLLLWYAFYSTGDNASSFLGKIWYTWYDPETCTEVGDGGSSQQATAISPGNCHPNFPNPTL